MAPIAGRRGNFEKFPRWEISPFLSVQNKPQKEGFY
jgi:hypothetical protein